VGRFNGTHFNDERFEKVTPNNLTIRIMTGYVVVTGTCGQAFSMTLDHWKQFRDGVDYEIEIERRVKERYGQIMRCCE
jgi:hypothetical protein